MNHSLVVYCVYPETLEGIEMLVLENSIGVVGWVGGVVEDNEVLGACLVRHSQLEVDFVSASQVRAIMFT